MPRISMAEWERAGPDQAALAGLSLALDVAAQDRAEKLRSRIDIRPCYGGLEVTTTSHVGFVTVGPLQVAVRPKLAPALLARLLRYAYGLRDLGETFDEQPAPADRHGLQDILVALLASETEDLIRRGLARRYVERAEALASPRGRLDVLALSRRGGMIEATIPCNFVERSADWHLNRVLRAGLRLAAVLVTDRGLARRTLALAATMDAVGVGGPMKLTAAGVTVALGELTRLTAAAEPALRIVELLLDGLGLAFEGEDAPTRIPGFLFDMNAFFERLLSRLLRENLAEARVLDQASIGDLFRYEPAWNPRRLASPKPRPDFAIIRRGKPANYLDAKYRDVWDKSYPAAWLYQLSAYALASPTRMATMLYPTVTAEAKEERIAIRAPIPAGSAPIGRVSFRPVLLARLADLVSPTPTIGASRRDFAEQLAAADL